MTDDKKIKVAEFKRIVHAGRVDVIRPGDVIDTGRARRFGLKTAVRQAPKDAVKDGAKTATPDGGPWPRAVGKGGPNGWYELPDGSRVQGDDKAAEAYAEYLELSAGDAGGKE